MKMRLQKKRSYQICLLVHSKFLSSYTLRDKKTPTQWSGGAFRDPAPALLLGSAFARAAKPVLHFGENAGSFIMTSERICKRLQLTNRLITSSCEWFVVVGKSSLIGYFLFADRAGRD